MKRTIFFSYKTKILCSLMVLFIVHLNLSIAQTEQDLQQKVQLQGTVLDANNQEPLPGVTVLIKGTDEGTITDLEGKFSLEARIGFTLQFSYVGYLNEEHLVSSSETNITISLAPDIIGMDEVVVIGYGTQKKSDLTGAVSSVAGEQLTKQPIAGVDQALQGLAAGVNIIPKTGRPGSGVDIQIRGITSINGTNPLIVIDGVSQDDNALRRLNPGDVESIEVLKDAASAAIYGASGGNGVILVTTKSGQSGKLKTTFNTYMGVEEVISQLDLMNSQQWMELLEETSSPRAPITTRPDTFQTYNWQDIIFKQAFSQNYDLSFNGGNEVSSFLVSSSLNIQDGIIKSTDNQRFTLRVNSEHKLSKRIKFAERVSYVNVVNHGFEDWEYEQYYSNPVMPALQMAPYLPAYDKDGNWTINGFGGGTNPLVQLDMKNKTRRTNNLEGNFSLSLELIDGLDFTSRFTGSLGMSDAKEYKGIYYASATDSRTQNSIDQNMSKSMSWNLQNILTYTKTLLDDHNITLMAGTEANRYWGYDIYGTRVDFASEVPEMLYLGTSTNDTLDKQAIEGGGYEGRGYRYFGRLSYNYKGKYLIQANLSRDYSTSFGPNNREGNFPSFSVGWKFSQEGFMPDLPYLSFGKLRAGYGVTGANARSGFPYLTQILKPNTFKYSFDNSISQIGAGPVQVANPAIKWEEVKMSNIGLDLNFFNYKLSFTADYFIKENKGMLMYQDVPYVAGTWSMGAYADGDETSPEVNVGSVKNKGVEFTIGYKESKGVFNYSLNMNLAIVRNKVIDLATDSIYTGAAHNVSPITLTAVGGSISEFNGYLTEGLFKESDPVEIINGQEVITNQPSYVDDNGNVVYAQPKAIPGDVRYVDANKDGQITAEDKVSLGSPLPKFSFGFTANLGYKNFDVYMHFSGTYGNKVFNGTKQYLYYSQGNGNRLAAFANRYKDEVIKDGIVVVTENHDTDIPRFNAANYTESSDFFIEDGSFIRLRTLQLGYTLPGSLTNKVGVERLRIYIGAKNLFTLSSYSAFNPEVSSGDYGTMGLGIDFGNYPATKMYLAGVNLSF